MSNPVHSIGARTATLNQAWETKRRGALKRFIEAWESLDSGEQSEALNAALDALTVSHIAARFELDRGSPTDWHDRA